MKENLIKQAYFEGCAQTLPDAVTFEPTLRGGAVKQWEEKGHLLT